MLTTFGIQSLEFAVYFRCHFQQIWLAMSRGGVGMRAGRPSRAMSSEGASLGGARDGPTQGIHVVRNQQRQLQDLVPICIKL